MGSRRGSRKYVNIGKKLKYRKPLRPFVCSTFQDFQEERDILVKKVFPAIDALCRLRGTYCAPVDLRWGINDSQAKSGHVVTLCLDYVTQCAPFFVCLLGERYGSHRPPDSNPLPPGFKDLSEESHWLDKNLVMASASGYDWVTSERFRNCSVTELECEQREFLAAEYGDNFSHYYFRQPSHVELLHTELPDAERDAKLKVFEAESEYCARKMAELKARIVKKALPVKYFRTPEELCMMALQDWKAVVDTLYPPFYRSVSSKTEMVAELLSHAAFVETRRRVYVRTRDLEDLFNDLTQFALTALVKAPEVPIPPPPTAFSISRRLRNKPEPQASRITSVLLLVGERGSGKTSVLANWIGDFQGCHDEMRVISHFVGSSAQSTDVVSLMRRCTVELREERLGMDTRSGSVTETDPNDFLHVSEAFHAALSLGPCVLVFDGVDELGETYSHSVQQVKEMGWLPHPLPPQCKIIVTSSKSDATHLSLGQRKDTQTLQVPPLNDDVTKSDVVRRHLSIHCKSLDEQQLDRIVSCKLSDRPLFLTVLANELRLYGVYSQLDSYLESYLEATSLRDLWSKIVRRWIRDYSCFHEGAGPDVDSDVSMELTGWVADALRLIAVSKHGLSKTEILGMLEMLGFHGDDKVTSLAWAMFRSAAQESLIERPGGCITFFHQHFKEAVEHTLFASATPSVFHDKHTFAKPQVSLTPLEPSVNERLPSPQIFHHHVAQYFLPKQHCARRTEELPWQLERAGDFHTLETVLAEPKVFIDIAGDKLLHPRRIEMLQYWAVLKQAGHDPAVTYWRMLKRALGWNEEETRRMLCQSADNSSDLHSTGSSLSSAAEDQDLEDFLSATDPAAIPRITMTSPSSRDSRTTAGQDSVLRPALTDRGPSPTYSEANYRTPPPETESENNIHDSRDDDGEDDDDEDDEDESCAADNQSESPIGLRTETIDGDEDSEDEGFVDGRASCPMALARLTISVGQLLAVLSYFRDAEKMLLTAHRKLKQLHMSNPEFKQLLCGLEEGVGNMYRFQLRNRDASDWYHRALESVDEVLMELQDAETIRFMKEMKGRLLDYIGFMRSHSRQFSEAERLLGQAMMCFKESGSLIGKANAAHHIGYLRMKQGRWSEAESLFRQSLATLEVWFGTSHPRVSEVLDDFGILLCHPRNKHSPDLTEAEFKFRRALQIREQCFGPDHLLVATTLFNLGRLLKGKTGRMAKAESRDMLKRSLDVRSQQLGVDHALTQAVRRCLNDLEMSLKQRPSEILKRRSGDYPYSRLSWHEDDLRRLSAKMTEKGFDNVTHRTKTSDVTDGAKPDVMVQGYNGDVIQGMPLAVALPRQTSLLTGSTSLKQGDKGLSNESTRIEVVTDAGQGTKEDEEYLDNFSSTSSRVQNEHLRGKMRVSWASIQKSRRVQSAPYRPEPTSLLNRRLLSRERVAATSTSTSTLTSLTLRQRRHSAPPIGRSQHVAPLDPTRSHRDRCRPPTAHSIDIHNTYSLTRGPNSSIASLVIGPRGAEVSPGPMSPECARSAWYGVASRKPIFATNPLRRDNAGVGFRRGISIESAGDPH